MSSESALSDMAQKIISISLDSSKLVIHGDTEISIALDEPKLNVGKLYESVFLTIVEPTEIVVEIDRAIEGHPKARKIADDVKTIIEEASETINNELPDIIAQFTDECALENDELDESLSTEDDSDFDELF